MSLEELFEAIRQCEKCERHETRRIAVPGEGPRRADVFMLGEAPGKEEDKTGKPFVGRAGKYLTEVLEEYALPRESVYITGILKCWHPDLPKKQQVAICKPWSIQQIEAVQPKVILIMGLTSAGGMFGIKKLQDAPGEIEWRGIPCIITCHPASAMRFPERNEQFRNGLQRLKKKLAEVR